MRTCSANFKVLSKMEDKETLPDRSSTKSKKMETPAKPNNGSRVKLKVVKKKVNIRRPNGLNRSNTSFNTSLNASMKMKQTLRTNNRALAQALQLTKRDLALSNEVIASLNNEKQDLLLENAEINHLLSQGVDVQVNEKLKPVMLVFKTKIRDVSNRLGDVALAMKELSSCVTSQLCRMSNSNSRVNSLENCQQPSTPESTITSPAETRDVPKRRSSFYPPPALRNNTANMNDLSLIAESSFLNLDPVQNGIDVMDMVLENELEKCKVGDVKSINAAKPPQRVPLEERRSRSRRASKTRRQSMDEIDFGPNVVTTRKSRRSSFFLSPTGLETDLCPETASDDTTGSGNEVRDDDDDDNKMVETEQLASPTLLDDDATSLRAEIDEVFSDMNQDVQPDLPETTQFDSPMQFPDAPTEQQQQDLAPFVADASLVNTESLPQTQAEHIDRTVFNEEDMELTDVIDASLHLNVQVSSFTDAQSSKETKALDGQSTKETDVPSTKNTKEADAPSTKKTKEADAPSTKKTKEADAPSTKKTKETDVPSTKKTKEADAPSTKKTKEADAQNTKEMEKPTPADPVNTKESSQNEDTAFVKPVKAPKKKAESKKDDKKSTKTTKEKVKETSAEDENKAVVELRLPKPGKIIFSAMRKNIAGVRPSPPKKARSKKKLAEMKRDELAAEPKNLFDFHDKTPQMLAKKPESAETGIYDVSLNDTVYGTCQSLGEYRERVAMAKRTTVNTNEVPPTSTDGNGEAALEAVPDTSTKAAEEKRVRARSRKAIEADEDKKKRARSKKRVADSDSEGDTSSKLDEEKKMRARSRKAVDDEDKKKRARSKKRVADSDSEGDTSSKAAEEKKVRARSRKAVDGDEDKKKRARSKKRVAGSDSDSDTSSKLDEEKKMRARSRKAVDDEDKKKRARSKKRVADSDSEGDTSSKAAEEKKVRARSRKAVDGDEDKKKRARSKKRVAGSDSDSDTSSKLDEEKKMRARSRKAVDDEDKKKRARSKKRVADSDSEGDTSSKAAEEKKVRARSRKAVDGDEDKKKRARSKKRVAGSDSDSDTSSKLDEEKKMRARSRKAVDDEDKKKRARSKKRVADSDSEAEVDTTYVRHYEKTVKSGDTDAAPEREYTRRARSRVVNYKEAESDFDMTLNETKTQVPLKNTEKPKENVADSKDSSSGTKEENPKRESGPNSQDLESENAPKKETGRKSLKETDEKRTRSRKKSVAAVKNNDQSDHPSTEGGESSEKVSKRSTQSGLMSLISQMEKLQKKCSRPQQQSETKPEEEPQNLPEATSKPQSSSIGIFERYKQALARSNDTDQKGELKERQSSKSRSRPARNESSDKTTVQNGRSRSLHVRRTSDSVDDKVEPRPKRTQSGEQTASDHSSPVKKPEESPEARRKSKTDRGRSKSRARSTARSKSKVHRARSTSAEGEKPEESPDTLQRKIRKDRGRSRSKAAVDKNNDSDVIDNEVLTSDRPEEVKPAADSDRRKTIRNRSIARRELLEKLKSSNADKENKATTDTNVQNPNMDANRKSDSNVTVKGSKSSFGHSKPDSDSLKTISTNVPVKARTLSPKVSLEKNPGKRLSEYTTDENQDLKRPRRATKAMSYKEPSISTKLRQGDTIFGEAPVHRISTGQANLPMMFDGSNLRKRSILENVTNLNC